MKVLCDVCKGEAAAVYCCADEAALCGACDARVHRANKLAGKHRRFSLLHPASPQRLPTCDICQEKRALLFCREDRALLCCDCDAPIHAANDLTRKHSRFLLTGIKLSSSATPTEAEAAGSLPVSATTSEEAGEPPGDDVDHVKSSRRHLAVDGAAKQQKGPPAEDIGYRGKVTAQDKVPVSSGSGGAAAAGGGSSISEYLIKELPGWGVEDFLLDAVPALHPAAFPFSSKMTSDDLTPFLEADLDDAAAALPADGCGNLSVWWVPQVPQVTLPAPQGSTHDSGQQRHHAGMGSGDLSKLVARQLLQQQYQLQGQQQHQRWVSDDCFTVPEISSTAAEPHRRQNPPSYKRPRPATSWCIS